MPAGACTPTPDGAPRGRAAPPHPAQPAELVLATDDRRDRVESAGEVTCALRGNEHRAVRAARPEHLNRRGQSLHLRVAGLLELAAVHGPGEVCDALTDQHLSGLRARAQPGGEIERAAAI